jgi:hypothetical protein
MAETELNKTWLFNRLMQMKNSAVKEPAEFDAEPMSCSNGKV